MKKVSELEGGTSSEWTGYTPESRASELLLGLGIPVGPAFRPDKLKVAPGWKLQVLLSAGVLSEYYCAR
jgi:hypothetical protein